MSKYKIDDLVVDSGTSRRRKRRKKKRNNKLYIGAGAALILALLVLFSLTNTGTEIVDVSDIGGEMGTAPAPDIEEYISPEVDDQLSAEEEKEELKGQLASIEQDIKETLRENGAPADTMNVYAAQVSEENRSEPLPQNIVENGGMVREANQTMASASGSQIPGGSTAGKMEIEVHEEGNAKEEIAENNVSIMQKERHETSEGNVTDIMKSAVAAGTPQIVKEAEGKEIPVGEKIQKEVSLLTVKKESGRTSKTKESQALNAKKGTNDAMYYIQIGVFNREPTKAYLSKLKSSGLKYLVVSSGKTRRVRIGPYRTSQSAAEAVRKIKEKIGIEGFVVKSTKVSAQDNADIRSGKVSGKHSGHSAHRSKKKRNGLFGLFEKKPRYFIKVRRSARSGDTDKIVSNVRKAGLHSVIEKGGRSHSVLVGPYSSYSKARAALGKVGRVTHSKGYIVRSK